jgi:hypothetical protein
MTWKDVPLFEIDGRRIDVAVGLALGVPDLTEPTDMVLRYPVKSDAVLIEAGPGFGGGFRVKLQPTGKLAAGEVEVRCRQTGADGAFGVRVTDAETGAVLTEEVGAAGRWVTVRA